jgi:phosphomannomutase
MDLLKRKPNSTIIADIKVSQALFDEITRIGGQAIMWKTGHSHIKAKMKESGALLAGEVSGHFFFKEAYYGFDDGLYAAIKLLHLLSHSSQTLEEFYDTLPSLPSTTEIRIPCISKEKYKILQNIKFRLRTQGYLFNDIDGIRLQLDEGWWLLRASHTQDILVARCESSTREGLEYIKQHLKNELAKEQIFHSLA